MATSRLENVFSISSFIDSIVDWLDILLLPNTDLTKEEVDAAQLLQYMC